MAESIIPSETTTPAPASGNHALVGRRLGRYEVLCHLATGGMATVYIARAQGLAGFERLVAIKLLHPHLAHEEDFVGMFLDEARLAARIRHPNVVATQDISDSDGDGFFLVMDYVEGDHLARMLGRAVKRGRRLEEGIVGRIIVDALSGLDAAHRISDDRGESLQLVHRDISPENILVGTDGIARLTDFGVARAEVRVSSTRAGQFKGKIAYMSPEQASKGDCDQRSDLFSMGVVFWEALTSKRLFRGDSNATTLARLLNDPIPAPSTIDPSLAPWDAVLEKALARDPDRRFQTATDFIDAIDEVIVDLGGLASPRTLGAMVTELVGDKVSDEQRRIRLSLDAYSVADEATTTGAPLTSSESGTIRVRPTSPKIPLPSTRSQSNIPAVGSKPNIPAFDPTASGEFSQSGAVYVIDQHPRRTSVILAVSLILVAAAAAAAGYFANHASQDRRPVIIQTTAPSPEVARTTPTTGVPPSLAADPSSMTRATTRPSSAPRSDGPAMRRRTLGRIPVEDNPYRVGD